MTYQTAWYSRFRIAVATESSTMSAQRKRNPSGHNILDSRMEHQEVKHHQSVVSCCKSVEIHKRVDNKCNNIRTTENRKHKFQTPQSRKLNETNRLASWVTYCNGYMCICLLSLVD